MAPRHHACHAILMDGVWIYFHTAGVKRHLFCFWISTTNPYLDVQAAIICMTDQMLRVHCIFEILAPSLLFNA